MRIWPRLFRSKNTSIKPNIKKLVKGRNVDGLITALKDPDRDVRREAAQALGDLKDTRGIHPLIDALADTESSVRSKVAYALGDLGDTIAVESLIKALGDSSSDVRWIAASALGRIGSKRATEPLYEALADSDRLVRITVVEALEKIKTKKSQANSDVEAPWAKKAIHLAKEQVLKYEKTGQSEKAAYWRNRVALFEEEYREEKAKLKSKEKAKLEDKRTQREAEAKAWQEVPLNAGIVSIGVTNDIRQLQQIAQSKLKPEIEALVDEIIRLINGINQLYSNQSSLSPSDQERETKFYKRLRSIGEQLYQKGGMDLTYLVFYRIKNKSGGRLPGSMLNTAWDGIGKWYE